jgi:hypothetical protein
MGAVLLANRFAGGKFSGATEKRQKEKVSFQGNVCALDPPAVGDPVVCIYCALESASRASRRCSAQFLSVEGLILPSGVLKPTPSVLISNRTVSRSVITLWYLDSDNAL